MIMGKNEKKIWKRSLAAGILILCFIASSIPALAYKEPRTHAYDMIDVSKFRVDLNVEKCKQFILWANVGFTNQILDNIRNSADKNPDYNHIITTLDDYLDELRKVFYVADREGTD